MAGQEEQAQNLVGEGKFRSRFARASSGRAEYTKAVYTELYALSINAGTW